MTRVFAGSLVALLAVPVLAGQAPRTFNVAVVRADGVLIPFAQFDRGRWRPFWTGVQSRGGLTVPLTLEDVDRAWWRGKAPSLDWTLWRDEGGPLALRVTAPRMVGTPCGSQVALATDMPAAEPLPPPDQAPFPKAGLATTSAEIALEPITAVRPEDDDWSRVARALDRHFRAAELAELRAMRWNHPVRSDLRDRAPIDLQAVWTVNDSRFFYVEAMRRYPDPNPPRGEPPCELVTYVAGYLWEERSGDLRPAGLTALITYCHMERALFLWPLGVIRDSGKQYWVFQSAGWTGEIYGVAEPVPGRGIVHSRVWHVAGRCPLAGGRP